MRTSRVVALSAALAASTALLGLAAPVGADPVGTLAPGSTLAPGATLSSPDGTHTLTMQTDGNLVLYAPTGPTFATGTAGHPGAVLADQTDGNLVVYTATGQPLWATGTSSPGGTTLQVQDDGNLVAYTTTGRPLWASGTATPPPTPPGVLPAGGVLRAGGPTYELRSPGGGTAFAVFSGEVAVDAYNDLAGVAAWSRGGDTGATGPDASVVVLQTDGNLVLYRSTGQPLWASGTAGSGATRLAVQDDGNVVLYRADGRPVWSTGTTRLLLAPGQGMSSGETWRRQVASGPAPTLAMQSDGNLVVYGNEPWSSGTSGHPGARLELQGDGNLVVHDASGRPLWSSGTAGCGDQTYALFSGDLELIRHGQLLWDSLSDHVDAGC